MKTGQEAIESLRRTISAIEARAYTTRDDIKTLRAIAEQLEEQIERAAVLEEDAGNIY